jgi:hypothetical protein
MAHVGTSVVQLLPRHRLRFIAISFVLMALALLIISFATARGSQTIFGPTLGADYAGFYSAATLLNTGPPEQLYDLALQDKTYHTVFPDDPGHLPYLHPPFVAAALRPLARLPYAWSFGVWLGLSACLYLAGLALALKGLGSLPSADRRLAALLALSFEPFLMECWMGCQLSAFGFCCLALAYYLIETGRPTAAGAALPARACRPGAGAAGCAAGAIAGAGALRVDAGAGPFRRRAGFSVPGAAEHPGVWGTAGRPVVPGPRLANPGWAVPGPGHRQGADHAAFYAAFLPQRRPPHVGELDR